MPVIIEQSSVKRARILAEKLSTIIPDFIDLPFWSLPILEALVERIQALEATTLPPLQANEDEAPRTS